MSNGVQGVEQHGRRVFHSWEHTKEGEVADSKRGGRSSDDEFDENDLAGLDDADFDADDADDDADESAPTGRKSVAGSTSSNKAAKKRDGSDLSLVGRLVKFIREVVAELSKVIYPTRKELITYTSVVLVFVIVVMTVVSLLDVGFAKLMFLVFGDKTTS
jgi:preprotein translocase subunit SecE